MNVIYMVSVKPIADKQQNRIETFNEFTIMLCCHCVNCFLNLDIPIETRDIIGWALMAFASFNIAVNICIIICTTILDMIDSYRRKLLVKSGNSFFLKRLANRKYILE